MARNLWSSVISSILMYLKKLDLIFSGELNIEYRADYVHVTAEEIPNAKLILYEGYRYALMMRNRKQVEKNIISFL
ncbi:MAG: hypothetical protein ACFFC3_15695 [Candidatus Odinarchaeota archaeon]